MEIFRKIYKKTPVPESLFNKVAGFYPATSPKERRPTQVFSENFARYLIHLFYRIPPGDDCFCFTEKHFTNKIEKSPLRKEKKWKQLVRKTTTQAEQKLNHYLHQVPYPFTI